VLPLGKEGIAKTSAKEAGGTGDQDPLSGQNTVPPRFEITPALSRVPHSSRETFSVVGSVLSPQGFN
jgi:hypothetical protein